MPSLAAVAANLLTLIGVFVIGCAVMVAAVEAEARMSRWVRRRRITRN